MSSLKFSRALNLWAGFLMESILLGKDFYKARFKVLEIKLEFERESRSWGRGNKQTEVNSPNVRTNRNWYLGAPSRTKKFHS